MSTKNQSATTAAKKDEATKALSNEQKQTIVVAKDVKQEEPAKSEAPTVDVVLAKLYDKIEVAKKLEFLKEQKRQLNAFALGDDRMQTRVMLEDAAGREWTTSNPVLLHQVFGVCKLVVDEKIKDAESELLAA